VRRIRLSAGFKDRDYIIEEVAEKHSKRTTVIITPKGKAISLSPLSFDEAVTDILKIGPMPKDKGPQNLGRKKGKQKSPLPEGGRGPSLAKRPPASLKKP
jgi:hypothetical protein